MSNIAAPARVAEAPATYAAAPAPYELTPLRLVLLQALRQAFAHDAAARRALTRLEDAISEGKVVVTSFDGLEGRVLSVSRGAEVEHVFTATDCTCEGARHPWHVHPMLFRLMAAEWAVSDPHSLTRAILAAHGAPQRPAVVDEPPALTDADRPAWANDGAYAGHYRSEFGQ